MKKIKDSKFYMALFLTLIFFGLFVKMDFATDTYSVLGSDPREIFDHFMLSGRFITAFCWETVNILNFNDNLIYILSYIMAIICTTLSIYELFKMINEKIKNDYLSLVISTITIINPFSIELFMYIEKGILTLAVLLSVLAIKEFTRFLDGNKKSLIFMEIYMLIAVFCYQGVVGIFIAISVVYVVLYSRSVKEFIKNNIIILLGYGLPAVINFLTVRLAFINDRVNGKIILSESIEKIINGTKSMLNTYGILPKGFFLILLVLMIALTLFIIIFNKEKISKKIIKILGLFYVIIANLGITIAPQIMQNTSSIWFVPRSTYPFASLIGIIAIYILLCTNKFFIKNKIKLRNICVISISIFLIIIQFYRFNEIELDHYNLNYLDKLNSMQIGQKIKEYEEKNGKKVKYICIYQDQNVSYTYNGLIAIGDINITGFYPDWSIVNMINYFNNLNLEEKEKDSMIEIQFLQKDWNNYSDEQLIFKDDTLHYCKF